MSRRATVWAFGVSCPSPLAKLVLLKLADHANRQGTCWPTQTRVAQDCGLSRETVNRMVKLLVKANLVRVEHRANGKGKQASLYFLLCDAPPHLQCDAQSHPDVTHSHNPCDPQSHCDVTHRHIEPSIEPSNEPLAPNGAIARVPRARATPRPRQSPVATLYEGAYLAAQAFSARHRLDSGDSEPPPVALLGRRRPP